MGSSPRKAQRELGYELKKLRLQAGLSAANFGAPHGWSQSKVSKSERGDTLLPPDDVRTWAESAGADEDTITDLVAKATELEADSKSWAATHGTLADRNAYIGTVEALSTTVRNFQPSLVAGLLQTADYARRVLTLIDPDGEHDNAAAVAKRVDRQTVLYDVSKQFEFVMTEGALRWRPGPPSLMRAQLDRILSIATLPNVTIGVLPHEQEATMLHLNGFTIFDYADRPFVLVETYHLDDRIDDETIVASYRQVFAGLREAAVTGDDAATVIQQALADLPAD